MGKPSVSQRPPQGDVLRADEIIGALDTLSPEDKLKLAGIEAIRRRGTGFRSGELIHEAVCRALLGSRRCPRDVPFMAFMAMTMRGIASHERKKRRSTGLLGAGAHDVPNMAASPEDQLIERQDAAAVQTLQDLFEDDPDAQLVLLGWQDGLRGAELREATGLNQGKLDYAIRRIRTRMRKAYPQGWMP
jgi:DNA-directed RNA polymerase specialized sigma24 family protein